VRGSERFADKAYLQSNAASKEVRRPRNVVSSHKILSVVAAHMKCDRKYLLTSKRGRGVDNTGRVLAMKLCQEEGGMRLREMAGLFQVGSDSAVSRTVKRINEVLDHDVEINLLYIKYSSRLDPLRVFAVSIRLYKFALAVAPRWLLLNNYALRPITNGRIAFSAGLLSIGHAPFLIYLDSSFQYLSV